MKPNNARAYTAIRNLKQSVQIQDADGMQAFSVLYMAQLEAISQ